MVPKRFAALSILAVTLVFTVAAVASDASRWPALAMLVGCLLLGAVISLRAERRRQNRTTKHELRLVEGGEDFDLPSSEGSGRSWESRCCAKACPLACSRS